jgi:hypothetical protein
MDDAPKETWELLIHDATTGQELHRIYPPESLRESWKRRGWWDAPVSLAANKRFTVTMFERATPTDVTDRRVSSFFLEMAMQRLGASQASKPDAVTITEMKPPMVVPPTNMMGPQATNVMRTLAIRIAEGDQAAFDELRSVAIELYRNINYANEPDRVRSNLSLMRAAFRELGEQAGRSNAPALAALQSAVFTPQLRSHATDALGIAAAAGNEEALNMLLLHQDWNMLLSSTVFALRAPAEKGNEQAIDFLIAVLGNPKHRALWNGASDGLKTAATNGNAKAKVALEQYEQANPK